MRIATSTLLCVMVGTAGAAESLFEDARSRNGLQPETYQLSEYAVQVNNVVIDLEAPADELRIDVPGVRSVTAYLERVDTIGKGIVSWVGSVAGDAGGSVILVRNGDVVHGSIRFDHRYFDLTTTSDGLQVIREIYEDDLQLRELPPTPVFLDAANGSSSTNDVETRGLEDGSRLDLLVVYTAQAMNAGGGQAGVEARIALGVAETNTSYINSGIDTELNLTRTEMIDYTESGDIFVDRNRLRGKTDGFMDEVHVRRNVFAADLTKLIVSSGGCGIAYIMNPVSPTFEEFAFDVTGYGCISPNYTFAHEIGHLQSARHDWEADPTNNSPFSFNHGYADPDGQWRTVMSYNNCPGAGPCTRSLYWSNPNINHPVNGNVTGVPDGEPEAAHNQMTLNMTKDTVANFRNGIDEIFTDGGFE